VPLDWAMTQNNPGTALTTLGERESGTAHLAAAVAAYQAALEERTRARVPLDWAMTQNNLGTALEKLGERESGTAHLTTAVSAYDAALEVFVLAGADYYVNVCRNNRDRAQTLLAKKDHK
jgi:tetratricopeptide (TPR) repeat protein